MKHSSRVNDTMKKPKSIPADIDQLVAKAREALKGHDEVLFAYLFDSLARDVFSPISDIDIAVYVSDVRDLMKEKLELLGDLMDGMGTDEIDLVVLNTAPLPLKARVLRSKELLLDREPYLRHSFESLVLREYFDFSIKEAAILERRFSLQNSPNDD
jgi:predicted nucleotidyltransferase